MGEVVGNRSTGTGDRKRFSKGERGYLWLAALMTVPGIIFAATGRSLDLLIDGGTICAMAVAQVFLVRTCATWRRAFEESIARSSVSRIRERSHLN